MSSQFKKAHKTHALAQPAGRLYPHFSGGTGAHPGEREDGALESFVLLCELVPDATERAEMLGVQPAMEAAWSRGELLPLLRTRRKALRRALTTVAPLAK